MALFGNSQTAQALVQTANLLNQTLQFQQQMKQRQSEQDNQVLLRERALQAKEREMKATAEATKIEQATEVLKFQKLKAETELKQGDLRGQMLKDAHLKLSAGDPVQTNRRFQDLAGLTSERNRLSSSLDRFLKDFLAADSPRVDELRKQIGSVDESIQFRLESMAGQGFDKNEALAPVKTSAIQDTAAPAPTAPPVVNSAAATAATAQPQDVAITQLYANFVGGKGQAKTDAFAALSRTFQGASSEATVSMLNQLGAELINQGLSREEAKKQLLELREQIRAGR